MKISVIGTGYISKNFLSQCKYYDDVEIQAVLTRRALKSITDFPFKNRLTNNIESLIGSDIVFECTGSVDWANQVIRCVTNRRIPVVTMNSEFQITYGSSYINKMVTESRGDQPGAFAVLKNEIEEMGFVPHGYLNIKGFSDLDPTIDKCRYWADRLGISACTVMGSLDGTKIQIEQCLIANAFNLNLMSKYMIGEKHENEGTIKLRYHFPTPFTDFVITDCLPKGVAILAYHNPEQKQCLKYLGLGDAPYMMTRPYRLCHLEVIKSLRQTLYYDEILLTNSHKPRHNVYAIAKHKIAKGTKIDRPVGNIHIRGICEQTNPELIPIGMLEHCVVVNDIGESEFIKRGDVEYVEV